MSVHKRLAELQDAKFILPDPGASGAIKTTHNFACVPLVTAAAETRTLAAPTKEMQFIALSMITDGGDCVVTVASAFDEAGSTTLTFANVGEAVVLYSVPVSISSGVKTFAWRVLTKDNVRVNSTRIVNVPAATTALSLTATEHADKLVLLPIITGAGLTITLPAATGTGDIYRVLNNGVQTTSLTITALAGDLFYGRADVFTATITEGPDSFLADQSDDIKYTFNVTTMGGIGKDEAEFIDIATDAWLVHIRAYGSGTLATGFA